MAKVAPKQHIYIVPGYGVPKDIVRDVNMTAYLRGVANYIFEKTVGSDQAPMVIFSGGLTDMWPPCRRTEAAEMFRWMKSIITSKDFREVSRRWQFKLEQKSISTLENLIFSAKFIRPNSAVTVFSEYTRRGRWKKILAAKKVVKARVVPIDFDISANRYRAARVRAKERAMAKFDLWALRNRANLRQHHAFFKGRLQYLRQAGPKNQVAAIHRFWQEGATMLPPEMKKLLVRHA